MQAAPPCTQLRVEAGGATGRLWVFVLLSPELVTVSVMVNVVSVVTL
jgi:hypothetical protein